MRKQCKKLILPAAVCLLCLYVLRMLPAAAADIPTLFHNDDPWYKDGVSPLVEREDVRYIPADIFSMFDYMKVSTPTQNNLLIHNTETGAYVSILFKEQSALINGILHEKIGVFRDSGVYYVEADTICEELGFFTRLYIRDDGSITMQICDENVISTSLTALIRSYMPGETEDGYGEEDLAPEPEHGKVSEAAVLYLFCRDTNTTDEFQAKKILDQEKLNYTLFLHSESQPGTLIRQNIVGMCGLTLPDLIKDGDITGAMDDINSRFTGITRGWVYLTVSTGDDNWDESLRNAGYCPVKPDFVVNGGSDPDALINSILGTADERGWCSIWLENCWNTEIFFSRAMVSFCMAGPPLVKVGSGSGLYQYRE